ncbi:hypothetical protein AB0I84_40810 [Streptomyces spectabilis]
MSEAATPLAGSTAKSVSTGGRPVAVVPVTVETPVVAAVAMPRGETR